MDSFVTTILYLNVVWVYKRPPSLIRLLCVLSSLLCVFNADLGWRYTLMEKLGQQLPFRSQGEHMHPPIARASGGTCVSYVGLSRVAVSVDEIASTAVGLPADVLVYRGRCCT